MARDSKRSKKKVEPESESESEGELVFNYEDDDDHSDELNSDEMEYKDDEKFDNGDGDDDDNDGDGDDDDDDDDEEISEWKSVLQDKAEMDELEEEYKNLRDQQRGILSDLKRHKDEDMLKGQAVKNQKVLWDKTLELRFLIQKPFSSSNRLPQESVRSLFCDSDESVNAAYSDLVTSSKKTLDSLLELEEALLEKNPSILQATDGKNGEKSNHTRSSKSSNANNDEDWHRVSQMHKRVASFRDKSIDKWQRKSQITTGVAAIKGRLHAFNQNISDQVSTYMRDPSRMMKQMQLRRNTVGVFGAAQDLETNPKQEESKYDVVAQADGDPELIDDSEFYQQLLKEFFETTDLTSNETVMYALKRLQTKKRKLVDRRASKGRKIRYHVHTDLQNFMTPQIRNINIPSALGSFSNLFQTKTLNSTFVE